MIWRLGDPVQGPVLTFPDGVTSIKTLLLSLFLIWKMVAGTPVGSALVGLGCPGSVPSPSKCQQ